MRTKLARVGVLTYATGPSSLAGLEVEIYLLQLASDETQNSGPELGHIPVRPGLKTLPRHPQKP